MIVSTRVAPDDSCYLARGTIIAAFLIPLEAKGLCSMTGVKGARDAIRNRQPASPQRDFEPDLNDGKDWSEEDIRDLKAAWEHGAER